MNSPLPLLALALIAALPAIGRADTKPAAKPTPNTKSDTTAESKSEAKTKGKDTAAKTAKFKIHTSIKSARKQAAEEKKPVLMLFTASIWCEPCKRLEHEVLEQKEFKEWAAQNFVFYVCDMKDNPNPTTAEAKELTKKYRVSGYPMMILTDAEGTVIVEKIPAPKDRTVAGFISNYTILKAHAESRAKSAPGPAAAN